MDLRVSANTPDKLHNMHLHRETQSQGTRCLLILPQRLLKAGECILVNMDCGPWSPRWPLETRLYALWQGGFVSLRVIRAGEEILPFG